MDIHTDFIIGDHLDTLRIWFNITLDTFTALGSDTAHLALMAAYMLSLSKRGREGGRKKMGPIGGQGFHKPGNYFN